MCLGRVSWREGEGWGELAVRGAVWLAVPGWPVPGSINCRRLALAHGTGPAGWPRICLRHLQPLPHNALPPLPASVPLPLRSCLLMVVVRLAPPQATLPTAWGVRDGVVAVLLLLRLCCLRGAMQQAVSPVLCPHTPHFTQLRPTRSTSLQACR